MVSGGGPIGLHTRLDSALVAQWPDPIDMANDIFVPGRTAAFMSQLIAALQSRNLWTVISSTDPSIESVIADNPTSTRAECMEGLQEVMATRQRQKQALASLLPGLIKTSSLTYMQNEQLSALVQTGSGVLIWEFIAQAVDLRFGVVQDKLQVKYDNLKVSPADSVATVAQQVDLKWFLFKHHTLYNVQTEFGRREGIRAILKMLLSAEWSWQHCDRGNLGLVTSRHVPSFGTAVRGSMGLSTARKLQALRRATGWSPGPGPRTALPAVQLRRRQCNVFHVRQRQRGQMAALLWAYALR